jgi:Fe-S cluster assembly protein SufD
MTRTPAAAAAERFLALYRAFAGNGAGGAPAWLRALRDDAIGRFTALGFPTPRDEAWRTTNIAPVLETAFAPAPGAAPAPAVLDRFLVETGTARHALVFVNGRFAPSLSAVGALPTGVRIGSLAAAVAEDAGPAREHLGRVAGLGQAFAALNAAFLADGAFLYVPRGVTVPEPLQVLYLTTAADAALVTHPRTLVVLEAGARATLVETYAGLEPGAVYLTNAVTETLVGDEARLDHYRVQRESAAAYHVAGSHARQGERAVLHSTLVVFGAALARHEVSVVLDGEGGELTLNGVSVLSGRQHADHHTTLDHAKPHCDSREVFNTVLDGHARSVFTGRIIVRPGAQKTDSKQTSNNLILSGDARADSQPQLEIYADDVKCTHGSTTGPLDPNTLYYLRSRGLGVAEARTLLAYGFGTEILTRIEVPGVRAELDRLLQHWLAGERRAR